MNRIIILFILLPVLVLAACVRPFGDIGGFQKYDAMWTSVYRDAYEINDLFRRHSDLAVFTVYNGSVRAVPIENTAISIIEDPDWSDEEVYVAPDENYPFLKAGRKVVVVRYEGMLNRYSITVTDPFEIDPVGPGGEGGSIIIEWYDPETHGP